MKGMKNSDREFCKRICSARISEEQKEILEQFISSLKEMKRLMRFLISGVN